MAGDKGKAKARDTGTDLNYDPELETDLEDYNVSSSLPPTVSQAPMGKG